MTDTTKHKKQILRRLNVVFRQFDLPVQTETNKAISQAESNYWIQGEKFHTACHAAMDQEQIDKDNELMEKFGF